MESPPRLEEAAPTATPAHDKDSAFEVPRFLHVLGGWIDRHPNFWRWVGRLETNLLAEQLASVRVERPIFVCGLARSGSTLLHEIIAGIPGVASQRLKDYPLLFTPYWWRCATAKQGAHVPRETRSPRRRDDYARQSRSLGRNALDGVLPRGSRSRLKQSDRGRNQSAALRDLLRCAHPQADAGGRCQPLRGKEQLSRVRLPYLLRLFPDAKFIIPIRAPATHIVSLLRQHQWFSAGHREFPRSLAYMQRSGHFEFGLDRRPMNLGDANRVRQILESWAGGDEIRGLARYWDMVYDYLDRLLAADSRVAPPRWWYASRRSAPHPRTLFERYSPTANCKILTAAPSSGLPPSARRPITGRISRPQTWR